jgi:hypothetical protein
LLQQLYPAQKKPRKTIQPSKQLGLDVNKPKPPKNKPEQTQKKQHLELKKQRLGKRSYQKVFIPCS